MLVKSVELLFCFELTHEAKGPQRILSIFDITSAIAALQFHSLVEKSDTTSERPDLCDLFYVLSHQRKANKNSKYEKCRECHRKYVVTKACSFGTFCFR